MKRRAFFKACAGALAGVAGWAMKPKQTDGIITEDDYKSLSSDYTIGDADKGMLQIHSMKIVAPKGKVWMWDEEFNEYIIFDSPQSVKEEFARLDSEGWMISPDRIHNRDILVFCHADHIPMVSHHKDNHWTFPKPMTYV